MQRFIQIKSPYFYIPVFLFYFVYVILRAIYVNPFCDEIGTFFDYVETGNIWEEAPNFSSANNHLLITFIARFFYLIFGNNMFLFRLISILSFLIYFISTYKIVDKIITSKFKVFVFLGLMSITWMNDFFSYARGYGFAISCYFLSVYLLLLWKESKQKMMFLCILSLQYFSILANLSYINSSLVLCFLLFLILLTFDNDFKNWIFYISLFILYFVFLLPLIQYSFELKEVGALWWGSKTGWWESSVQQLVELTLFIKNQYLFYIFSFIGLLLLSFIIYLFFKNKFIYFIKNDKGILISLFLGHVILTQLLVSILHVNYPSDRVAMIYVPFFLLLFSFLIDYFNKFHFLFFLFLFFPISFIFQMNLDTSRYMSHTRVSNKSIQEIEKILNKNVSFEMDGLNYRNYVYHMRNKEKVLIANVKHSENEVIKCQYKMISDVNDSWKPNNKYELIYKEKHSNTRLYELKTKFKKQLVFDTTIPVLNSNLEFLNLFSEKEVEKLIPSNLYQIQFEGKLLFHERPLNFNLVYACKDEFTVNKVYQSINFVNYCELQKPLQFNWISPFYSKESNKEKFILYFWNLEKIQCSLKNVHVKIYSLKTL